MTNKQLLIASASSFFLLLSTESVRAEACTEATIPTLVWPLERPEVEYRKDLLPFGDAWCNHRIAYNSEFNSNILLDPETAFGRLNGLDNNGEYTCWGKCPGAEKAWIHSGIDITLERTFAPGELKGSIVGTPVFSVWPGKVTFTRWHNEWLNYVVIRHDEPCTFYSIYWHLGSLSVATGQDIETATPIGTVGDLNYASPTVRDMDHLHLGIRLAESGNLTYGALPPLGAETGCNRYNLITFDSPPDNAPYGFIDPARLSYSSPIFHDVSCSGDIWFARAALALNRAGIIQGRGGLFEGTATITKAEFLKILLKVTNRTATDTVPGNSHWSDPFVTKAVEEGILDSAANFNPDSPLLRRTAFEWLARATSSIQGNYTVFILPADIDTEDPLYQRVLDLLRLNIASGKKGNVMIGESQNLFYLHMDDYLNRAEAAKLICRTGYHFGLDCDSTCQDAH